MTPEAILSAKKERDAFALKLRQRYEELAAMRSRQKDESEARHHLGKAEKGMREQTIQNKAYLKGRMAEVAFMYKDITGREITVP